MYSKSGGGTYVAVRTRRIRSLNHLLVNVIVNHVLRPFRVDCIT